MVFYEVIKDLHLTDIWSFVCSLNPISGSVLHLYVVIFKPPEDILTKSDSLLIVVWIKRLQVLNFVRVKMKIQMGNASHWSVNMFDVFGGFELFLHSHLIFQPSIRFARGYLPMFESHYLLREIITFTFRRYACTAKPRCSPVHRSSATKRGGVGRDHNDGPKSLPCPPLTYELLCPLETIRFRDCYKIIFGNL